jgi:hypothetical protein
LPDPAPEALVADLGDADSDVIKVHISWWTRPRQHQMLTTYDQVLTTIGKTLAEAAPQQAPDKQSRVAWAEAHNLHEKFQL